MIIATHLLLEFSECHVRLSNATYIENSLLACVAHANLTPLHQYFHDFNPPGVTGIIALKESHISIHTWPDQAYAVLDFLTCGDREKGLEACRYLKNPAGGEHEIDRNPMRQRDQSIDCHNRVTTILPPR